MKIIHTSDWHLGRSLYGKKRHHEFAAFLDWLAETIIAQKIDLLLVSGDVFDTSMPSNRAQELYYRFLCRVSHSCCRQVVIIAGNHDSPSFLNAPRELLHPLKIQVIGSVTDTPDDQVIEILDYHEGVLNPAASALVCAVPYLRDKDLRTAEPGETIDDKNRKLIAGITKHYGEVFQIASQKRSRLLQGPVTDNRLQIPIIVMGHLFATGAQTVEGDGVRELYVGSLAQVGAEIFPAGIDYLALGHLHIPQKIGDIPHFRYCGSPLPIGFGEANQQKSVVLVDFSGLEPPPGAAGSSAEVQPRISLLPVPRFQELARVTGPLAEILETIHRLKAENSRSWLEIEYTGGEIVGNLKATLEEALDESALEILRIKNKRVLEQATGPETARKTLDELDTSEVFSRCLEAHRIAETQRAELTASYTEIVTALAEEDRNEH